MLEVVPIPEWDERLPIRCLYATPEFLDQIEEDKRLHDSALAIGRRTLYEHLWERMSDFRCGESAGCGDLLRVIPTQKRVWTLHANGLRLYGWAPEKRALALVNYALEAETHSIKGLVAQRREDFLGFIVRYALNDTMQIGDYLAVFSDKQG